MRFDKQQGACWILLTPWNYAGIGGQPGEEAWVLGAQFLQNYYTIYIGSLQPARHFFQKELLIFLPFEGPAASGRNSKIKKNPRF